MQLRPEFGFDDAAALAGYLADLGISHVYSSPYLQASPGSTHGYDVVDPHRVSADLGGPVAHQRFGATLGEHDLGQVLDIVPNHMAINGPENPWWWDVLENGPGSRYARFFDVDWDSDDPNFRATVLLPVLGDQYGRVLEAGQLRVQRDRASFVVAYGEQTFPVAPPSLADLLVAAGREADSDELVVIGEFFARLPPPTRTDRDSVTRRHRGKEVLKLQLRRLLLDRPEIGTAVDEQLDALNHDVERLDALLGQQNYRLAYWRAARDDLDYRRFFDVTSLAGLRMEDEYVFDETHELVLEWLHDGTLDGLRVDHPDGLRDPARYFERLRAASARAWIVAEKILEPGEQLRSDWPVDGTTGYDFLNLVTRLFIDPAGEAPLTELYEELTGEQRPFREIAYEARQQVVRDVQASEAARLTEYLLAVVRGHRRQRDYSRVQLRDTLRELLCVFPVYRTYVRAEAGAIEPIDERYIRAAAAEALRRRPDLSEELLEFIVELLTLRVAGEREAEFVMRFQQLTGPVMAKGVEDTAFYRYNRLVALNEVGGDPGLFSASLDEFHAACADAQRHWPRRMLASTTHDTKRSEGVRARIALLAEIPDRWASEVRQWRQLNAPKRSGAWPDANSEYLLYQTLVGAWPIDEQRLWGYLEKAVREQKVNTSWTDANAEYEQALHNFAARCLADRQFVRRLEALLAELTPAWQLTSLAQTLLKLTCPGVPDIYQGTELWDLSLVDPDNRREVDFELRRDLLTRARTATAQEALAGLDEGLTKLWLIQRTLRLRRRRPELFGPSGRYRPLRATGSRADHVVAFARGGEAVVVVPRLIQRLGGRWGRTSLELPTGQWQNEFTGRRQRGGRVQVAGLLSDFPVALLMPAAL